MSRLKNFLLGLLSISLLTLTIFALFSPIKQNEISFLFGFAICFILFSVGIVSFYLWFLRYNPESARNSNGSVRPHSNQKFRILSYALLIFSIILSLVMILKNNQLLGTHYENQQLQIKHNEELVDSNRKKGLVILMENMLDQVNVELGLRDDGILSDDLIKRIASLSHAFEPDRKAYFELDSSSQQSYSQEKGQLLMSLFSMPIDSSSFQKIKKLSTFSGAYLASETLSGFDLSHMDLNCANLKGANLKGANLEGTNLKGANMWGVNLNNSILSYAMLNRVDLRWATMNDASIVWADLKGANLESSELRRANLKKADLKVTNFKNAILIDANLSETTLFQSKFIKANLTNTDFSKSDLRRADMTQSILNKTNFTEALIHKIGIEDPDWLSNLELVQVIGRKSIQDEYTIVENNSTHPKYSVIRKEE